MKTQTYANHAKYDPWFHVVLFGLNLAGLALAGYLLYQGFSFQALWALVIQLGVFLLSFITRVYALKVQDRVIRLEERLRMERLLPERLRQQIPDLTEDQMVGLRFASDAELAGLVERALKEGMNRTQIKQSVRNWRPDHFRV